MDQLEQHWDHLPLKKRPIKEIYIPNFENSNFNNNYYENSFYMCNEYSISNRRRHITSNSSTNSDYSADNVSIDSGFIDNDSPLDLSRSCPLRSTSPHIFKYDPQVIFGKFSFNLNFKLKLLSV